MRISTPGRRTRRGAASTIRSCTDVSTDQQQKGLETYLTIDRDTRGAPRHHAAADRQHALRRLRPASGIDHLQRDQPISRRHGGRPALQQYPKSLKRRLRQRPRAARAPGTADQRRRGDRAGTATRREAPAAATTAAARRRPPRDRQCGAQLCDQCARQYRPRRRPPPGAAVSARSKETMIPLAAFSHFGRGNTPLSVNHQGTVRRLDDLVQSGAGQIARRRPGRINAADGAHRHAGRDPRQLRRARRRLFQQSLANEPILILAAIARRLHRARRAVRELRPPDHHPVDAAVGRRRRAARAAAVPHRVQHHRADRRDPADRHRQEERHHDDRLRARGASARAA